MDNASSPDGAGPARELRYAQLERLCGLTNRVASAKGLVAICDAGLEALIEVLPGRRCSLLLFDATGVMRFQSFRGLSEAYRIAVDGHSPWHPGQVGAVGFTTDDTFADPTLTQYRAVFEKENIRGLAFVPLIGRDGVIGKFMLYGEEPGSCTPADLRLMELIADSVAIAVTRHQVETALRASREELLRERNIFTSGPVMVFRWRYAPGWPVEYVSTNVAQLGFSPDDFTSGRVLYASIVHPDDLERVGAEVEANLAAGAMAFQQSYRLRTAAGTYRALHDYTVVSRDALGQVNALYGYVVDDTERLLLEEQLRQSQKMDSVGRLAGGVAHDFNNLLMVIGGYAHLALQRSAPNTEVYAFIEHIRSAQKEAADLTRQLLTFARKQYVNPKVVELDEIIGHTHTILERIVGEDVKLVLTTHAQSWTVRVDSGQIQQVLINLVANGRDAMPHGGTLAIETEKVHLTAEEAGPLDLTPGDWVTLDVRDTGEGMTDEVRAHLFEPFFTTKPVGKGTGLGLATCHGIIHQSGGKIVAESALGKGTRFRIYLPRSLEAASPLAASEQPQSDVTSPATILVVEDAPFVRALTVRILRASGYTVLEAESGAAADRVVDEFDRPIDLLLSDVVMPGESGAHLAARLRQTRPDLAVLFMSGYSGDVQLERGVAREGVPVLDKPFLPDKLLDSVRKALESKTDPARRDR